MPRPDTQKPNDIRERIARDEYRVDPRAIAEAIVRRLLAAQAQPPPRP